jgi:hypothetical protein
VQGNRHCRYPHWWQRHCFSAFKVSAKMTYSWGKLQGRRAGRHQIIGINLKLVNNTSMVIGTNLTSAN